MYKKNPVNWGVASNLTLGNFRKLVGMCETDITVLNHDVYDISVIFHRVFNGKMV